MRASAAGRPARLASAQRSISGSSSSRPVVPGSDSPNGSCLASSSTGVWSEQTASTVPSRTPSLSASRSRSVRNGGTTWHCASK